MQNREKSAAAQLKIRIKEPLRKQIEVAAAENGVSMNSEIESRLEKSFRLESRAAQMSLEMREISGIIAGIELAGSGRWYEKASTAATVFQMVGAYLRTFLREDWRNHEYFDRIFGSDEIADHSIHAMLDRLPKKERDK